VTGFKLLYNRWHSRTVKQETIMSSTLPDSPPDLDQTISLTEGDIKKIEAVLKELSEGLEALPVVVSQESQVVAMAGVPDPSIAERISKQAWRTWREGSQNSARELLRFEEEVFEETEARANLMIYSTHIAGSLVLSVGWQLPLSLTQVRAETGDARSQIMKLLATTKG
jgi:adenylosuccinate lyase